VREALAAAGSPRPVRVLDARIETSGAWTVEGDGPLSAAEALARLGAADVCFLALHGGAGEDGTIQGLLETHDLPYTGSGVRASALCMDKHALRLVAAEVGLAVPPGFVASGRDWARVPEAVLDRARTLGDGGWFVKPRFGGSSVATSAVARPGELTAAIDRALSDGGDVLLEAWVRGVEVSCGVLGDHDGELRVLMPIEIQPAAGAFFDYQQKYDAERGARELCPPPSLDERGRDRVREAAERAHRTAGCRGYSRVDFICPPAGEPVLLEVNTLPGLTPRSLLPQEAACEGLGYRDLVLEIVDRALARPAGA